MGTLGTFDSFTTARLGIYAAQHGLRVTGNNISNINTVGYTRQRIDQVSFKTGGNDRYASQFERHIGSGALVNSISQIRDPYLDIRYRTSSADTGYYDTKLGGLQEIAAILDEVGKGGKDGDDTSKGDGLLYAQLQNLAEQLRAYGADPTSANDTLVRGAAEALTMMIRDYAGRLEKVREDMVDDLHKDVDAVNGILTNIRNLNESIRDAEIHGDKALELRDERNRQIDALSEYMHIKVVYSMEDVGAGIEVEKLTIYLGDANSDPAVETDSSMLVDGLYATQISIPKQKPVANQYTQDYLKGYLYTKEVADDSEELTKFLADMKLNKADLVEATDENGDPKKDAAGKQLYILGTNDAAAEGIVTEENNNYTIQLGKLLDRKDLEWKNSTTEWAEVQGGTVGVNAIYKATLQLAPGANLPPNIEIGGTPYNIPDTVKTVEDLASFVAGKLNGANPDYTITANGPDIVFTAKTAGVVGPNGNGPATPPSLILNPNGGGLTLSAVTEDTAGVDSAPPANPDPPEGTVTDKFGNTITTAYTEMNGKWFRVTVKTEHTREVALADNDLHGSLQAHREMLTEEGEFSSEKDVFLDPNAKTKRGIPYYQKSFNLLAQQIAKHYNELNQGFLVNQDGNYIDADGKELQLPGADGVNAPVSKYNGLTDLQAQNLINNGFILKDEKGNPILDEKGNPQADVNAWLKDNGAVKAEGSGPLFSNSNDGDDTTGITALNINVSHGWSSREVHVVPKFEVLFADDKNPDGSMDHTTKNINVNHMISLIDKPLVYDPKDADPEAVGKIIFTGSFNDMFSNMMGVQAEDARITNISLNNSYTTLVSLDSQREGVSGVDLNDEAMNMMQFQKAYSAACRLMTTIDEALDRLINNTGIAGR